MNETLLLGAKTLYSIKKQFLFLLLLLLPLKSFPDEKEPIIQLRVLAHHIAHKIVHAAVEDCVKRGYLVSAAVVDRNGNLAAFLRNPLSGVHTIKVSKQKAFSSATLRTKTSEIAPRRSDLSFAPDILLIVGGVPINFAGNFYGGVGVAGARPDIDELCALAGIEAVSEIMEFVD